MLLPIAEEWPLYGGVIVCHVVFGKKIFVRCLEVSVIWRCLLMEVPLHALFVGPGDVVFMSFCYCLNIRFYS